MQTKRFIGENPKVGIRPVIDGRQGGVRESLEEQTMNMAGRVAELITSTLKYTDGTPVQCVIADSTIGRVPEAAACAEKFRKEGVGLTISVTPCWCYGSETIDYDDRMPKAIWGFNGTERPGAVYLAAALAGHNQKGMPAFGIYGHDVQDADTQTIPNDVKEKLLRFTRAGIAVAQMRGKSYLSIGSVTMGIAGSIVDTDFFQTYLGMRNESVDEVEIIRRIEEGIYDKEEFKKAMAWTEKYCKTNEGHDFNPADKQKSRAQKDADWEYIVKMMIIIARFDVRQSEACANWDSRRRHWWPQRDRRGLPGPAPVDRPPAQRRLRRGDAQHRRSTGTASAKPFVLATENDSLNGAGDALQQTAHRQRTGIRRRAHLLEPRGCGTRDGQAPDGGAARERFHPPDQLRCGESRRQRRTDQGRQTGDEALLGDHRGGRPRSA